MRIITITILALAKEKAVSIIRSSLMQKVFNPRTIIIKVGLMDPVPPLLDVLPQKHC